MRWVVGVGAADSVQGLVACPEGVPLLSRSHCNVQSESRLIVVEPLLPKEIWTSSPLKSGDCDGSGKAGQLRRRTGAVSVGVRGATRWLRLRRPRGARAPIWVSVSIADRESPERRALGVFRAFRCGHRCAGRAAVRARGALSAAARRYGEPACFRPSGVVDLDTGCSVAGPRRADVD
jgi:hypothetical protein